MTTYFADTVLINLRGQVKLIQKKPFLMSSPTYKLACEVVSCKDAIRCVSCQAPNTIMTGCLGGHVHKIKLSGATREVETPTVSNEIPKSPVYAISCCKELTYIGNQKGTIMRLNTATVPVGQLIGHAKPVCSLDASVQGVLLSGSWDATVRVWNTETDRSLLTLNSNHSHGTCVAGLNDALAVTGSQSKSLNLWSLVNGQMLHTLPEVHGDIIRRIAVIQSSVGVDSAFITCSNDGTVKFWTVSNDMKIQPLPVEGLQSSCWVPHGGTSFLFDCAACVIDSTVLGVVASDDGYASAFFGHCLRESEDGSVSSILLESVTDVWRHPTTVWSVALLDRQDSHPWPDVVTACADGIVRVFTPVPSLAMSDEAIAEKQRALEEALAATAAASESIDYSALPRAVDRESIRGKRAGQTTLFRSDDGRIEVHSWTGSEWQKVGDMVAPPQDEIRSPTQFYQGDDFFPAGVYDHVFTVEIETKPGTQTSLPYRMTDNPMEVAERFCARESISKHNVPDIIKFINQNTTGQTQPTRPTPPPVSSPPKPMQQTSPAPGVSSLELQLPILYTQGTAWQAALNAIYDLDTKQEESLKLSPSARLALSALVAAMEKPNFDTATLRPSEINFLCSPDSPWTKWEPTSALFPFFDMWRKVACHIAATDYFRRNDQGNRQVLFALDILRKVGLYCPQPLPLCLLRWFANISHWSSTKKFFAEHSDKFAEQLSRLVDGLAESKSLEEVAAHNFTASALVALHAFIFNLSIALNAEARVMTPVPEAKERLRSKIEALAQCIVTVWKHFSHPPCAAQVVQSLAILKLSYKRVAEGSVSSSVEWPTPASLGIQSGSLNGGANAEAVVVLNS
eukprot:Blabericola_migrator_1__1386@NODE_135_length_13182_cov_103_341289_g117_i0_p3_GENE_NODE_135_length_13182_cov_103_341289_g117_i0NODE_135_length_13182_cov_103_341289_g117_i0_p3_ORF_typecomplete_len853_score114_17PFU/PF09070_11/3_4e24PUL/PF08324_11/2_2e15WD40_like/PF17005_5/0_00018WD40_like/PF17005_5/5_6e05WD40/PF00400_32/8_3e03WD40/PF00400_32/7_4e06WD40/PF00400_32/4e02WD40/PF00400_32/0_19WD40/PF00400_32/21ANAPC4_WD40/PF12894_7/0_00056ANAPC4_WD40/PF12894_7/0_06ANAPC4_WD40/PF12894_7/2_1e03ANAPC4_WD40